MEETIESPNGGHYAQCGDMKETEESNNILRVHECTGCGKTTVRASALSKTIVGIGTLGATVAFGSIDFVAPATASASMAELYPAFGPTLGVLVLLSCAWVLRGLEYGVTVQDGDVDE